MGREARFFFRPASWGEREMMKRRRKKMRVGWARVHFFSFIFFVLLFHLIESFL